MGSPPFTARRGPIGSACATEELNTTVASIARNAERARAVGVEASEQAQQKGRAKGVE